MRYNAAIADMAGKIIVIALIAVFALTGALSFIRSLAGRESAPSARRPQTAAQTVTVSVKAVEPETIERAIKLNGEVASKTEVNLYPHTGGKVARLLVEPGSSVSRGEIIAYVDPSIPGSAFALSPVTAAVSGTIIDRPVSVGDTVSVSSLIATVGSLSDLEIRVNVSEKYNSYLSPGLRARLHSVSNPDNYIEARIHSVSPVVNKASRSLEVVLYPDQVGELKPGMYVSVSLVIEQAENALVIPKTALKAYNEELTVFRAGNDDRAERVGVTTGLENDTEVEITSGLSAGDRVIIAGSVTEGSPLRITDRSSY